MVETAHGGYEIDICLDAEDPSHLRATAQAKRNVDGSQGMDPD